MSLLLTITIDGCDVQEYFVPDEGKLPTNLRGAIERMNGVWCNSDEYEERHYKAWAYLSAATTINPDHLDPDNEFNANRFAHLLLPYRISADQSEFEVKGPLRYYRTGSY